MRGAELIAIAREGFLDDAKSPYLWSDTHLLRLANEAEREAARRAKLILDKTNATDANVYSGKATSTSSGNLVDSAASFVSAVALGKTVYNTTKNTFATVTSYVSGTSIGLSGDIMTTGESYVIGDPAKALTRVCVVAGTATYALSGKVLKVKSCYLASNGDPLVQKTEGWLDEFYHGWRVATGLPAYYIEDSGMITLVPKPETLLSSGTGKDTLFLEVFRLPLADFTLVANSGPEIPESYHIDLIHGICELAYQKQDAETGDAAKRVFHGEQFTRKFGPPMSARLEATIRALPSNFKLGVPKW